MEFRVLGTLGVRGEGGVEIEVRGSRRRSLLVMLLLQPGQVVSAERLIDGLWGDDPPRDGANALQVLVSKLRQTLGRDVVATRGPGYALEVPAGSVDVGVFEQLVAEGRAALAAGDPARAAERLREALALWRGPALADVAYEEFARTEIARLEEARAAAVEDLADADLLMGRHAEVIGELEAAVAGWPLRERLRGQLMTALYRSGRQAEALRVYQDARTVLAEELGLEPGPELRKLEAAVLAQDPSLDAVARPAAAPAAPTTPAEPAPPPSNLRAELTRFVGRADDLKVVMDLVSGNRLVTLVGPGGAGKTRLAAEVARGLPPHPGGVWMVELATVGCGCGCDVVTAVLTALGLSDADEVGSGPVPATDPLRRLTDFLAGRDVLLILDNCEHVVAEAAAVADEILRACPAVRVLATSREGLGLAGETLWPVPPLALDDGVELFLVRARAVSPTFEPDDGTVDLVADICRRLDGMPLAIELAAARCRALSVAQIAARLDDRFRLLTGGSRTALPRQQTLRAVVDWSYDLLFDEERRVFERLSVFSGGTTLEGAEAVCADTDVPAEDVADLVARLVDKSLVLVDHHADAARYRLLVTLAHYGRERLAATGDAAAVRDRHAHFFAELVETADAELHGPAQQPWIATIEGELDNIRAALDWSVERGEARLAQQLAGRLGWFWWLTGRAPEGARWLSAALACEGDVDTATRARALTWASWHGVHGPDPMAALPLGEEAIALWRQIDDPGSLALTLLLVGQLTYTRTGRSSARPLLDEGVELYRRMQDPWGMGVAALMEAAVSFADGRPDLPGARWAAQTLREVGDAWGVVMALSNQSEMAEALGDYDEAGSALSDALEIARSMGIRGLESTMLVRLGNVVLLAGDQERSARLHEEAVALARELGLPVFVALALNGTALGHRRAGRLTEARACNEEACQIYRRTSLHAGLTFALASLGFVAELDGDLHEAERRHREALDVARFMGDPRAIALALEGLAGTAAAAGDGVAAGRLLGRAHALRTEAGTPLPEPERVDVDRAEVRARAVAGDDAFEAEFEAGATLSVDDLVSAATTG